MKFVTAFWAVMSMLLVFLCFDYVVEHKKIQKQNMEILEKKNQQSFDELMNSLKKIQDDIDVFIKNKHDN